MATMDINKIKKMLQAQCEPDAVLSLCNTTKKEVEQVIEQPFEVFVERCKREGRALLQAKQFEVAMAKGANNSMLIHLGKQYLEQNNTDTDKNGQIKIDFTKHEVLFKKYDKA